MTPTPTKLPPNPIHHFYRGGPAIARLRGFAVDSDHTPEEWIGSTATLFGETDRGLSALPDGSLLRDAIAADPEAWLGPAHVERFGADPALLVKLLDTGERLPVHVHPDDRFAREHLGTKFGKTESWIVLDAKPGAELHLGWRGDVDEATLRRWVDDQDRDALLGALNPVPVRPGDALFVPAGEAHAIGEGVLIVELQEPTDMSILLEWQGYAHDANAATLGLGWDLALRAVDRRAREVGPLHGPRAEGALTELLPPAASTFFTAQSLDTSGGQVPLDQGFAVALVIHGAGELAGVDVARGDALVIPHAAGTAIADGHLRAIVCRPPRSSDG